MLCQILRFQLVLFPPSGHKNKWIQLSFQLDTSAKEKWRHIVMRTCCNLANLWVARTGWSEIIQLNESRCCLNYNPHHLSLFPPSYSNKLQVWQVQTVYKHHDSGDWLPAEEECGQQPLRLGQHGLRVHPALQQPGLQRRPAGARGFKGLMMCQSKNSIAPDKLWINCWI